MRLTQLTEGPCDVAKPEEIEKMSGTEYDKYAQWKKDCEAEERTTPLSTKRLESEETNDGYDDYHGDMSQEEYDQEVDNSQMEYAVWVGGTEVNDNWLNYEDAVALYDKYKEQGYDDIQLDARIKDSHVSEETTEEGNEFSGELAKAKIDGKKEFKVGGKTYKVEESITGDMMKADEKKRGNKRYGKFDKDGHWHSTSSPDPEDWERLIAQGYELVEGESEGRPYIVFHTKKGKFETHADTSYDAAKKAAAHWKLKSTGGLTVKLADVEHVADSVEVDGKEVTEILKPGSGPGAPKTGGSKLSPRRDLKKPLIHTPIKTSKSGYAESETETDEEQLDEILPVLAVGAAAAALGTAAYKGGKAIGNWLSKEKTATADTMPGDGMASQAAKDLENRKKQMSKNLAALKSESAFSKKVKEAADEDAEAVSARDDFVNMMSTKPNTTGKAIDTIKQIVADSQNMQVKFDDGKMKVDLYTASAVSQVYDAVKPETQAKMDTLLRTKAGMLKISNFAFSSLKEDIQRIEEAREEGRLDEWLPLAPLAWGAGRVLTGMAWRAMAKKFGKTAVKNAAGKFKQGMNPNSVATRIKPGGGDGVLKQIWKASGGKPVLKTTGAISGVDMYQGGDGSGRTIGGDVYNRVVGGNNSSNSNSSSNSKSKSNGMSNYWKVESVYSKNGKLINEYTGEDAVIDKNGKAHDPNSSKGRTIVNMKCNNPTVKDKTGCGTGIDKDKKRRRGAIVKKGVELATTGAKKAGKAVGNAIVSTGFGNPLSASKYSESKAEDIMKEAIKQTSIEK